MRTSGRRITDRLRWPVAAAIAATMALGTAVPAIAQAQGDPGPEGQQITVSKTADLDRAGETITVTGTGFDIAKGIYLAFCVDNGPGVTPSPCIGGVDMTGESGSSVWISSNPPPYGVDLAKPYTDEGDGRGGFEFDLRLASSDEYTDCLDEGVVCSVITRADHTRAGDRSQDVRVPVTFAEPRPIADPSVTLSASEGLDPAGDTVTVSGTGFNLPPGVPGIYAVFGPHNEDYWTDASVYHSAAFLTAADLASGSFETDLDVVAEYETGSGVIDCVAVGCEVLTFAAHGSTDRTLDTFTPVSFADTATELDPALTVSKTEGLGAQGESVEVTGSGFAPGQGIYLAQTVELGEAAYPETYTSAAWLSAVDESGTFTETIELAPSFEKDGRAVDCAKQDCYVAAFNDHTAIADRSQDVWVPITFAENKDVQQEPNGTGQATGPEGQQVEATPVDDLDPAGADVRVTGSGFDVDKNIYVALCVDNGPGAQPTPCVGGVDMSGEAGSSKWIGTDPYGSNLTIPWGSGGSFDVTLTVPAADEFVDCRETACSIITRRDHQAGGDRSQDTRIPVTWADGSNPGGQDDDQDDDDPTNPAPDGSGPDGSGPDGDNLGPAGNGGPGSESGPNSAVRNLASTGINGAWPLSLAAVALIGAGGLTLGLSRRRRANETE
ncbi:neocarzinostatin apoprotein domain-containing protein [Actinoalloteichus hymeniacidonis]|uniref:IPT/TIG domain-containing protein n=1 Tax=Actinoalloteichus hymeniacidonis TaxID=340345 RepID=A0AAC9HW30_9PSEU|nr:neocarzinostatin apoprotein domain-containing protein [Actinoalloteichus hymeniacidonis]AOS66081.1 hypothetical protein TL08_26560 [Actinoalloteichus hymeniacidonis]MBB5905815.1 hypothetical protein [Actinoalloteichus hymeniacidonis]